MMHPVIARNDLASVGYLKDPCLKALQSRVDMLAARNRVTHLTLSIEILLPRMQYLV